MALNTSGFQVGQTVGANFNPVAPLPLSYLDPRLFAVNSSEGLLQGLQTGANVASSAIDGAKAGMLISTSLQDRPLQIAKEVNDINQGSANVDLTRAQIAALPSEQELRAAQINEAAANTSLINQQVHGAARENALYDSFSGNGSNPSSNVTSAPLATPISGDLSFAPNPPAEQPLSHSSLPFPSMSGASISNGNEPAYGSALQALPQNVPSVSPQQPNSPITQSYGQTIGSEGTPGKGFVQHQVLGGGQLGTPGQIPYSIYDDTYRQQMLHNGYTAVPVQIPIKDGVNVPLPQQRADGLYQSAFQFDPKLKEDYQQKAVVDGETGKQYGYAADKEDADALKGALQAYKQVNTTIDNMQNYLDAHGGNYPGTPNSPDKATIANYRAQLVAPLEKLQSMKNTRITGPINTLIDSIAPNPNDPSQAYSPYSKNLIQTMMNNVRASSGDTLNAEYGSRAFTNPVNNIGSQADLYQKVKAGQLQAGDMILMPNPKLPGRLVSARVTPATIQAAQSWTPPQQQNTP